MTDSYWDGRAPFRVLCLAGGGVRARFQSEFLGHLEEELQAQFGDTSLRLADQFDLIAGSSTGAIVAAAMASRIPTRLVSEALEHMGGRSHRTSDPKKHPISKPSALDQIHLLPLLDELIGDRSMKDILQPHLLIPVSNSEPIGHRLFCNTLSDFATQTDGDVPLREIISASCRLPFRSVSQESYKTPSGHFMDGALWANDPTIVALTLAQKLIRDSARPIKILSIGTGVRPRGYSRRQFSLMTPSEALDPILEVMCGCQETASRWICNQWLGPDGFRSVNCDLSQCIAVDNVNAASVVLPRLAHDTWSEEKTQILSFLELGRSDHENHVSRTL